MIHVYVSFQDVLSNSFSASQDAGTPQLRPLGLWAPGDNFLPSDPWYAALSPSAQGLPFNSQYGFLIDSATSDFPPDGTSIGIRLLSATPGLQAQFYRATAPKSFTTVFTPSHDYVLWSGGMWHPVFTAPGAGNYEATFQFFLANAQHGLGRGLHHDSRGDAWLLDGFSLIELLVVIAIIAVLAGVASAGWQRARGSSQGARCLSQMRQLASAIHQWGADRGGEFPRSSHSAFAHRSRGWQREILPYLGGKDGRITPEVASRYFRCPADARTNGTSYGLNVFFELDPESDDYEGAPARWRRASALPSPSRTVLLAEIKTGSSADHVMAHFWSGSAEGSEVAVDRHGGRSNFVFADGSAALLRIADTHDPANGIDCWNPGRAGLPSPGQ